MLKISYLSFVLVAPLISVYSFEASSRREAFRLLGSAVAGLATTTSTSPAAAVISSKYCAAGVGEGCEELASGNNFIKSLQEKSAANREQNERVR